MAHPQAETRKKRMKLTMRPLEASAFGHQNPSQGIICIVHQFKAEAYREQKSYSQSMLSYPMWVASSTSFRLLNDSGRPAPPGRPFIGPPTTGLVPRPRVCDLRFLAVCCYRTGETRSSWPSWFDEEIQKPQTPSEPQWWKLQIISIKDLACHTQVNKIFLHRFKAVTKFVEPLVPALK
ncbi:hypothetical protein M413DRAFT_355304 [Hebeloma cylindrosporum]|uniref:Uncharacterized protein n=1 Tax=Hebeloma cylindrosporum TaxID=76867 RepID=A0A0C2Y3W4_HEBCY|nr:hypothetical protein M413DRAFT_355304 [Hebeloma cylindrosporum h7]